MSNPNWLDEDRRFAQVYAAQVHHLCVCTWIDDPDPETRPGPNVKLLAVRKFNCPIHGKNGTH